MIFKFYFLVLISFSIFPNEVKYNNSLFKFSYSPKVSSLGHTRFVSNDVGDIFSNPTSDYVLNTKKPYFAFLKYFEGNIDVLQINYNLFFNKKHKVDFGFISRQINDIYNTQYAWLDNNQNNIPSLDELDYSRIYQISDQEIGFLISYNLNLSKSLLSFKFKPHMHRIDNFSAHGIDIDFYINRKFNKFDVLLGCIDLSYKKWENGYDEYRKIKFLLGFSVLFDKNLIVYNYFEKQSSIGLEHKLLDKFSIRIGKAYDEKLTYGFGLFLDIVDLNYSNYKIESINENISFFSFTFNMKKIKSIIKEF